MILDLNSVETKNKGYWLNRGLRVLKGIKKFFTKVQFCAVLSGKWTDDIVMALIPWVILIEKRMGLKASQNIYSVSFNGQRRELQVDLGCQLTVQKIQTKSWSLGSKWFTTVAFH